MRIIDQKINLTEVKIMAKELFGDMVKAVVDVERKVMVIGGELHSDEEALLLENGSEQKNLWGINIYPELKEENFIEFSSMINLRPAQGNHSQEIEDPEIRKKIVDIVNMLIKK